MHQKAASATTNAARPTLWWARLAGIVSGVAGLTIADLVAQLVSPAGSPVAAVGEAVISLLPADLVNWGKDTLGAADKPILLATVAVVVLAVSGLAGQLELRRRSVGGLVYVLLAVLGIAGVILRSDSSLLSPVPTLVGLLVAYVILTSLTARLARWHPRRRLDDDDRASPTSSSARRSFLGLVIGVGAASAVAAVAGRALAGAANAAATARAALRLPAAATKAAPVPAGADLGIAGLTPYITANDEFYRIDTALQVPVINPDEWSLKIIGMVENEVEISFVDLLAKPLVEHVATLTCVSNRVGGDLVGNALWLGYPIRELLAQAKPLPGADMVLSRSDDDFTAGTPLDVLTDPKRQALLAVGMNGEPLPIEHGFPVRMVVPGLYGYVSATKWVVELKVTTFEEDYGYWTPLGWSARGPIKLASRIDTPRRGTIDAGTVAVAGVAWAQHTGISKVEVKIDEGGWQTAELAEITGADTWRQWHLSWAATPGDHTITVRATDANQMLQSDQIAEPAPDGASGWHSITVEVR